MRAGSESRLLLPGKVRACLFDLDGVITDTATLHEKAWKTTFDGFLAGQSGIEASRRAPFSSEDYERLVDGRPRLDGVRSFLSSRGIDLPEGAPSDGPADATLWGVANSKNELFLKSLANGRAHAYPGSLRLLAAVRESGLATALVSASANARAIVSALDLEGSFDVVIDAQALSSRHLAGKPAPDSYLAAAGDLGIAPAACAVFEDGQAGVVAARRGGFGCVVGVDRVGQREALESCGADLVVSDLAELVPGKRRSSASGGSR